MRPAIVILALLIFPAAAPAENGATAYPETGSEQPANISVKAKIAKNGRASIDPSAPAEIIRVINAGNRLIGKPYRYGGGHARFRDSGYDCSGAVSYALRGFLKRPLNSSDFISWGEKGRGRSITVYTNPGHAFLEVAGIRLDTSSAGDPRGRSGPRWRPRLKSKRGYQARHPSGF